MSNKHTHTDLTALFPGLPRCAGTRKVKPIWILLKQETVSGSGISWAICKSASRSRRITMPVPHHSSFLQAGCPSCYPINSVKALKVQYNTIIIIIIWSAKFGDVPDTLPTKQPIWDRPGVLESKAKVEASLASAHHRASFLAASCQHSGDWLFVRCPFPRAD